MDLFRKNYELSPNPPKALDFDSYSKIAQEKYSELLERGNTSEKDFQDFFEQNPSFIPGSYELLGHSGHSPFMCTLISQPEIGSMVRRKPDFMWLSGNSLYFCPVFVEIEDPKKNMFNKDNTYTAKFNQALQQIEEWQYILEQSTAKSSFYECYKIPLYEQEKIFAPQFLLIYGRRSEYEGNNLLKGIRAQKEKDNLRIMSFDRLRPDYESAQFTCCKVSNGEYNVISIPPTYRYGPDYAESLSKMRGFYEKIDSIENISSNRKDFLKNRYNYWIKFSEREDIGIICGGDFE